MEDFSLAQRKACSQETDSCLLWVPGAEKGRKILGVFVVSLLARGFYLLQKHTHQSQDTKKTRIFAFFFTGVIGCQKSFIKRLKIVTGPH